MCNASCYVPLCASVDTCRPRYVHRCYTYVCVSLFPVLPYMASTDTVAPTILVELYSFNVGIR